MKSEADGVSLFSLVVVNSAVSFLHPEWPFGFDMDEPLAIKTRMAFLDRAAADQNARGERLPLAAGRLALDDLTERTGGGGVLPAGLIT